MTGLPRNVAEVQALLAETGPLRPNEIIKQAADRGITIQGHLLELLPTRFGTYFTRQGEKLMLVGPEPGVDPPAATPLIEVKDGWWTGPSGLNPVNRDQVVVIAVSDEEHEPQSGVTRTLAVAAVNLATGHHTQVSVAERSTDGIHQLASFCPEGAVFLGEDESSATIGQLLDLTNAQTSADGDAPPSLPRRHLRMSVLSVLVDPGQAEHSTTVLADRWGVPPPGGDGPLERALHLRDLTLRLLDEVDPHDPNWRLAVRLLAEGREPWAAALNLPTPGEDLASALQVVPDPLVAPAGMAPKRGTPLQFVEDAFEALAADREGVIRHRPGQMEMAAEVARSLQSGGNLAVEAPPGTGKSLAYLVPACRQAAASGQAVVIATHTKVLQTQLRDDALTLRRAGVLSVPFRQIFGVGNYICTRELAETIRSRSARDGEWAAVAVALRSLVTVPTGVWDNVNDSPLADHSPGYRLQRSLLRTTSDGCDRRRCRHADQCPLMTRLPGREGGDEDERPGILAVNHALVAAWVEVARQGGTTPGDVLSEARSSLIFDEAHTLEDSLTSAWSRETGSEGLRILLATVFGRRGPVVEARREARGDTEIKEATRALDRLGVEVESVFTSLGEAVTTYVHEFGGENRLVDLRGRFVAAHPELRAMEQATRLAVAVLKRLRGALGELAALLGPGAEPGEEAVAPPAGAHSGVVRRIWLVLKEIDSHRELLERLLDRVDSHLWIYLVSTRDDAAHPERPQWTFSVVPVEVGPRFASEVVANTHSTILTSATMSVGGSFDYVTHRLGLRAVEEAATAGSGEGEGDAIPIRTLRVESPFDHSRQSAIVLTNHLPLPLPDTQEEFCEETGRDLTGFFSISGGRSLALFAARTRMEAVAEQIRMREAELAERGVTISVQGESGRWETRQRFLSQPGNVLLGLRSYWEGFDAPGETLSYLIIEKPPYPHPGDPVAAARQRAISDRGGDPFMDYVVPQTAIQLAQGFGRLVRSETDRGAAIVLERRMQLPTEANHLLLSALPTPNVHFATGREDAWTYAIEFVTGERPDLSWALDLPPDRLAEILARLELQPGEDPTDKLIQAAEEIFGITELRPEQLEMMRAMVEGRDALAILPTGSGKSICFQLPAILRPRPTIVVSPLIALIKDQLDDLRARRRIRVVDGITGQTPANQRTEILRGLTSGDVRLLYVSPERLTRDPILSRALAQLPLASIVVDEVHCVSSWGMDFRPEFRQIAPAIASLEGVNRVGFTATADRAVEADICTTLEMDDPLVVRHSVDRPDISYHVMLVNSDRDRSRELLRFIMASDDHPGIVYAWKRETTEQLAWLLRQAGFAARAYHAGLLPEQRSAIQEDFLSGTTTVIVATNAFGMGVNKPDVGWVVHYNLPDSLEAYAQESGRAARLPSITGEAVLLATKRDFASRRRMAGRPQDHEKPEVAAELLELAGRSPMRGRDHLIDPDEAAQRLSTDTTALNVMVAWLERSGHLRRYADVTVRAKVTMGVLKPDDPEEARMFFDLLKFKLSCRMGAPRFIEIDDFATAHSLDADELEETLSRWNLERLITFHPTQRRWRLELLSERLHHGRFEDQIRKWRGLRRRRFDAMASYVDSTECRRVSLARPFGDEPRTCAQIPGSRPCDICGEGPPPWHRIPAASVPDPEDLVQLELTVLQAVRWATHRPQDRYGEKTLLAALQGRESLGKGRPLGPGALSCPQFGAFRYLKSAERRLTETVEGLVAKGYLERREAEHRDQRYHTLALTEAGKAHLGGTLG